MESNTTLVETGAAAPGLLGLPVDILVLLPEYLHDIEDYMNVALTCRRFRKLMDTALPHTILCLASRSANLFFRPSPHFLVCAVARQIGDWARKSRENEAELAAGMPRGIDHLMDLALSKEQFGLTIEDIRRLYELRSSVVDPVSGLMGKAAKSGAWSDCGVHIRAIDTFFHLAIYGELFGPDFEPFLDHDYCHEPVLRVETRLEFIKYCIPEHGAVSFDDALDKTLPDGSVDPRRVVAIHPDGPYARDEQGRLPSMFNNMGGLLCLFRSIHWRPYLLNARLEAGAGWDYFYDPKSRWRQRILDNIMMCQGLEGLGMILSGTDIAEKWKPKIKAWKAQINALEEEPASTGAGAARAREYPDLLGELCICLYYCPAAIRFLPSG
ncbi:hypothetical protein F5Y05DRAFT_292418 [Hypoxylon sp. FL0543]|nr:hypothetical protein F5Y05DRAFT_292418 [Hypoxylon sp. FL0543]